MNRSVAASILLWVIAVLIAGISMIYQKRTGPTYPLAGEFRIGNQNVPYALSRSHGGEDDHRVKLPAMGLDLSGQLEWRRYQDTGEWRVEPLNLQNDTLFADLPHQPAAGKLEYRLRVATNSETRLVPGDEGVVIRFKGAVPAGVLIPHILFMVLAMILSTRAGLEALRPAGNLKRHVTAAVIALVIGGGILGPIVQKYAFGVLWAGVPFGWDLTDNKTLIALIFWVIALIGVRRNLLARPLVILATLVMFAVYLVPHSMHGSELDYAHYDSTGVIQNVPD